MLASFITTYFMALFEEPPSSIVYVGYSSGVYFYSPLSVMRDLIRAALKILQDGDIAATLGIVGDPATTRPASRTRALRPQAPPGLLKRFVRRFFLGLPIVGAGSLVHLLLSMPFLGPVQWLARYRGNRRRGDSNDIAAGLIVILLVIGALR